MAQSDDGRRAEISLFPPPSSSPFFVYYPTTNGCMQNGSSVGMYTQHSAYLHVTYLLTKFLHRSTVESLLRVRRCWLGTIVCVCVCLSSYTSPHFLRVPQEDGWVVDLELWLQRERRKSAYLVRREERRETLLGIPASQKGG